MALIRDDIFVSPRDDSREFYFKEYSPEGKSRAHIVFIHDVFDYHGIYQQFASKLSDDSFKVTLLDMRGFGCSGGARGVVDHHEDIVDDVEDYLKSLDHAVILVGHGFGGLVAIRLVHRQSLPTDKALKGLILSNPLLRFNNSLPRASGFIYDRLKHPFDMIYLPWSLKISDRSLSEKARLKLSEDPLIRRQMIFRTYKEIGKLIKLEQNASYLIDVPTLTLLSGSDTIGSRNFSRLFTKALDPDESKLIEYEKAYRDLLNDNENDDAVKDVLEWLKARY